MALTVSDGFPYYISLTEKMTLQTLLDDRHNMALFAGITEEKSTHRYAEGKWSIKQIIGHITDHERIMIYRALRFSRNDKTLLPGYDQDQLVDNAGFDEHPYSALLQDLINVRAATTSFMKLLLPEQMQRSGMAWKFNLNVDEMLRATVGHELHHVAVLRERYLIS